MQEGLHRRGEEKLMQKRRRKCGRFGVPCPVLLHPLPTSPVRAEGLQPLWLEAGALCHFEQPKTTV